MQQGACLSFLGAIPRLGVIVFSKDAHVDDTWGNLSVPGFGPVLYHICRRVSKVRRSGPHVVQNSAVCFDKKRQGHAEPVLLLVSSESTLAKSTTHCVAHKVFDCSSEGWAPQWRRPSVFCLLGRVVVWTDSGSENLCVFFCRAHVPEFAIPCRGLRVVVDQPEKSTHENVCAGVSH